MLTRAGSYQHMCDYLRRKYLPKECRPAPGDGTRHPSDEEMVHFLRFLMSVVYTMSGLTTEVVLRTLSESNILSIAPCRIDDGQQCAEGLRKALFENEFPK